MISRPHSVVSSQKSFLGTRRLCCERDFVKFLPLISAVEALPYTPLNNLPQCGDLRVLIVKRAGVEAFRVSLVLLTYYEKLFPTLSFSTLVSLQINAIHEISFFFRPNPKILQFLFFGLKAPSIISEK